MYMHATSDESSKQDALNGTMSHLALLAHAQELCGTDLYIVLADADNLASVNQAFGRSEGDRLLHKIGQTIAGVFGKDSTFHYGSDEFVIVCTPTDEQYLLAELARLNATLETLTLNDEPVGITCSFGYTYGNISNPEDLHESLRIADHHMFEAKRAGKACAVGGASTAQPQLGRQQAYRSYEVDKLTGLANLSYFRSAVARHLEESSDDHDAMTPGRRITVVFFNVQNFKGYNETFGFAAGDELLIMIGRAVASSYPNCIVARSGSDQFLVATTEDKAHKGIERVRSIFRSHIKDSSIWLKAGVYVIDDLSCDIGVACDRAKLACDAIKGRRDVYYRLYDDQLKHQIATHRYVLDHFDEALERGHIKVYYQPIVHVATGNVCDEEALARWEDPKRGIIYPDEFIPVLEEARLIHRLDLYIVRRSCENMRRRLRHGTVRDVPAVSVNLSRLDFELCDIVTEIEKILVYYDVPREYVSIEVTESALTGNQEFLKSEIDRFRADGFEVWMDDFGSGYSSLNLLKEYAFDLVKIDMGFLRGFEDNDNSRILLANVINLVKELGIKTLVEGVETQEQFSFLKGIGCGKAQGYYFSRPQSLQMVLRAIATETYPPIEPVASREFYSKLAHINLMRPDPTRNIDGHYVTSDSAAAILLRQDGVWSYLNVTDVYREFWRTTANQTTDQRIEVINGPHEAQRAILEEAVAASQASGSWARMDFTVGSQACAMRVRIIASDPKTGAIAVLTIVQ